MKPNAARTTKPDQQGERATITRNSFAQPGSQASANGVTNPTIPSALAAITRMSAMRPAADDQRGHRPSSMRPGGASTSEKPRNSVANPAKNSLTTPAARVVV